MTVNDPQPIWPSAAARPIGGGNQLSNDVRDQGVLKDGDLVLQPQLAALQAGQLHLIRRRLSAQGFDRLIKVAMLDTQSCQPSFDLDRVHVASLEGPAMPLKRAGSPRPGAAAKSVRRNRGKAGETATGFKRSPIPYPSKETKMEMRHLSALQAKHAHIDQRLSDEVHRPSPDDLLVAQLKKQKLRIKEEMSRP